MVHTGLSDAELMQQVHQKDDLAFKQLFDRYWQLLFQLALKKTGNTQEAEDMVQELFIEIWHKKEPVHLTSSLKTYLVSCMYLKIFSYFRKKGFREKHYADFARYLEQSSNLAPEVFEAEYGKLQDIITQTVRMMPQQMKTVFSLRHYHGESVAAIAEQLDISTETVKSHLKIAMSRLRKAGEQSPTGVILLPAFLSILESSY